MLLLSAAVATMALSSNAFSINSHLIRHASTRPSLTTHQPISPTVPRHMSTWDDFSFDDDDELLDSGVDADFVAADENDDPEVKAAAGASLEAPEVDYDGPLIDVPQGSQLELSEETVQGVLAACRQEIGTMFGYQAENRGVGITGGVDFVELDGPTVVLHLKGRFWHQRPTVLNRVGAYLMARIPEIVDVTVQDEYELTDEANNASI
ncbi:predicted protein [Thalassiosira pseudonana CCMP1335]|uniref:NIF system FeS cluster assembly NifU C-terminal domain-containing protein n=1 Tax=Thalassiosira pseudonana TaxID=35128 RepID=B8C039_THAPS|nr:predicted protein [Thalassiosira pseudonana CCMP1335]EED92996.1 predicted protein [Thalassiosira pseudonana CCMP1335]|eukprot:g11868.t1 g11868   contig6:757751-758709(-)